MRLLYHPPKLLFYIVSIYLVYFRTYNGKRQKIIFVKDKKPNKEKYHEDLFSLICFKSTLNKKGTRASLSDIWISFKF